jgi:hypothetical protein
VTSATYCTKEKQKTCEHWDNKTHDCEYRRKDETCFIGGIEKDYDTKLEVDE